MVNEDEAPKSAIELAMERLRKKDADAGVSDKPLSDEQRKEISEIRTVYEAKSAEREILHQADKRKVRDQEALDQLELEYRRDRERLASERDRKIEEVRRKG
jgi:hypothetical protein